jgi:DNA-binding NtrC family response regulator
MRSLARDTSLAALSVGIGKSEYRFLQDVFRGAGWLLFEAGERRQALQSVLENAIQVVIAERDVPSWHWQQILDDLRLLSCPPQLIVAARHADERLWAEALNVGAYDVLALPFDRSEVERVVDGARRHFDPHSARAMRAGTC